MIPELLPFVVEVTETLKYEVEIFAISKEEAEQIVFNRYSNGCLEVESKEVEVTTFKITKEDA